MKALTASSLTLRLLRKYIFKAEVARSVAQLPLASGAVRFRLLWVVPRPVGFRLWVGVHIYLSVRFRREYPARRLLGIMSNLARSHLPAPRAPLEQRPACLQVPVDLPAHRACVMRSRSSSAMTSCVCTKGWGVLLTPLY